MSIADKLITIANNTPLVCANLGEKKTVSGNSVAVGDVSSVEHSLDVKLISDTITDFSGVKVSRYGKNLFDVSKSNGFISQYSGISNSIEDNKIIVTCTVTARSAHLYLGEFEAGTYSVSCIATNSLNENFSVPYINIGESITSLTRILLNHSNNKHTFTITETQKIWLSSAGFRSETSPFTINEIMLEIGSTATEYEPYKIPQTATATADGTVEGLTSVSPNMTLISDSDVSIECTYKSGGNISANEKIIELQNAFADAKEIIQKYKIKMEE